VSLTAGGSYIEPGDRGGIPARKAIVGGKSTMRVPHEGDPNSVWEKNGSARKKTFPKKEKKGVLLGVGGGELPRL